MVHCSDVQKRVDLTMASLRFRTTVFYLLFVSRPAMFLISAFTMGATRRGFFTSSPSTRLVHRNSLSLWSSTSAQADNSARSRLRQQPKPMSSSNSKKTGGLRRLPVVKAPAELLSKARKIALRVKPDQEIKNAKNRAHKHGAESLNALTQALCLPLRDIVAGYKSEWRRLHPFERVVADLTAATRQKKDGLTLEQVLDEIHEARKMILEAGKDWIAKVKSAESAREAADAMQQGMDSLLELYQTYAGPAVAGLVELQRALRSAPIVQLDTPAVVLVGSPNVGKSSIVRAISSGTPEVNNYPFTTRGVTLGHVEVFWSDNAAIAKAVVPDPRRRPGSVSPDVVTGKYAFSQLCQVMDSPGLLVRPDGERNEMEALTLAAMQHLPTAVCYVMDLSGGAGDKCSSVEHQMALRREVRSRFPKRPWIDVISKVDLGVVDGAIEDLEEILRQEGGTMVPYIKLSIHEGLGVDELRAEILRMLGEVRVVLDAMAAVENDRSRL